MANGLQFLGNIATGVASGIQTAQSIQANQQKLEASELELKQRKQEQGARADLKEHLGVWITRSNNVGRQNDEGVKKWASQPTTPDKTPDTTSDTTSDATPDTTVVKDPGEYAGGGAAFSVIDDNGDVKPSSQWSYEAKASYYKWQRRQADSALNTLIGTYSILSPGDTLTIQKELKAELESKDSARMMGILAEAQSLVNGINGAALDSSISQEVTSDQLVEGGLNSLTSLINSNREFLQLPGTSTSVDMTGGEIRLLNTDGDRVTALRLDEFEKLVVDKNINLVGDAIKEVEEREAAKKASKLADIQIDTAALQLEFNKKTQKYNLDKAERESLKSDIDLQISQKNLDNMPAAERRAAEKHTAEIALAKAQTLKYEADALYENNPQYKAAQKLKNSNITGDQYKNILGIDLDPTYLGDTIDPDMQTKVDGYIPTFNNILNSTDDVRIANAANLKPFLEGSRVIHDVLYQIDPKGGISLNRVQELQEKVMGAEDKAGKLRAIEDFFKTKPDEKGRLVPSKISSVVAQEKFDGDKPVGIIVNFKTGSGVSMAIDLASLTTVHAQ